MPSLSGQESCGSRKQRLFEDRDSRLLPFRPCQFHLSLCPGRLSSRPNKNILPKAMLLHHHYFVCPWMIDYLVLQDLLEGYSTMHVRLKFSRIKWLSTWAESAASCTSVPQYLTALRLQGALSRVLVLISWSNSGSIPECQSVLKRIGPRRLEVKFAGLNLPIAVRLCSPLVAAASFMKMMNTVISSIKKLKYRR